jgi:tetratricopeptide (TPR) repeat protein
MQRNDTAGIKLLLKSKISLIILGFIFFLVLTEILIRVGGVVFSFRQEYTNRASVMKKGSYTIMCLGESTTALQYPGPLEDVLNKRNIGIRFSVIDKGIVGTNTSIILSQLRQNLDIYKPDMVILMAGSNDRLISYYKDIPEATSGIFQCCRVYRFIRLMYMHIANKLVQQDIRKVGAVALNAPNGAAYSRMALNFYRQGKIPEAIEAFKKAIDANPQNDDAYLRLGILYKDQGRIVMAEEAFRKAIDINPHNDGAYDALGILYKDQGKISQAEEAFRKAIDINPRNDDAYFRLGILYKSQSRFFEAVEALRQAIESNPRNDCAYCSLGYLYKDQGEFLKAVDLFRKAEEINPRNDDAPGALAVLYECLGKPDLAKEYARRVNRSILDFNTPLTAHNYRRIKEILDSRAIRFVAMQFPMRNVESLKNMFLGDEKGVIFIDNEAVFKEAVIKDGYKEFFCDMFGGDFGHCTKRGNLLMAENIADAIITKVFRK